MAGRISQYPSSITTLESGDLFDVSEFLNPGYESKKLDWDDLLTNLNSQLTFENIYTTDGTTTGQRTISIGTNDLIFGSTGDTNLLRFDATSDRLGIGIAAPTAKLHIEAGTSKGAVIESELIASSPLMEFINNDGAFGANQETQFDYKQGTSTTSRMSHVSYASNNWGFKFYTYQNFLNSTPTLTLRGDNLNGINTASPLANFQVQGITGNNPFRVDDGAAGISLMVLNGGNVGIGTTTPTEKLEVIGNALITSSSGNALKVATGSQPNALTIQSNGRTVLGSTVSAAAQLQIRTTGTGLAAAQFDCDIFNALTIRGGGEKFMANQAVPSSVAGGVTFFSNAGIAKFLSATGDSVELSSQTNAVGAATFVANTSGISDDSATFGGFTIGQIAQALLNNGLLK